MDVSGNRKAIVVYVPYRLRKAYRKIHSRLVRELEKKFSGKVLYSFLGLLRYVILAFFFIVFFLGLNDVFLLVYCYECACKYVVALAF